MKPYQDPAALLVAHIIVNCIKSKITQKILPENQCGIKSGRITMDMVVNLRWIRNICMPFYADIFKAFHIVARDSLWCLLKRYGITGTGVIKPMQTLHESMLTQVAKGTDTSKGFAVTNIVKQGCVLAPTLFSMYLSAMLIVAITDSKGNIFIKTCHDSTLFTMFYNQNP